MRCKYRIYNQNSKMILTINKANDLNSCDFLFNSTELCEIMGRNRSDKGHKNLKKTHNYTTVYYKLFKDLKNKQLNIFELGLGTNNTDVPSNMGINGRVGASLYGWSEFFPNASVFGADIDKRVLFNTEKIKTFYCDQTDPNSICDLWGNDDLKNIEFDILVEDGLHQHQAQICFFENSIHKVKSGGYYIIEDFNHGRPFEMMCDKFRSYKESNQYPNLSVEIYQLPPTSDHHKKNKNNGLVVIKKC